jgi:ribosomal protein L4
MKIPLINMSGETVGEVELNPAIFEAPVNVPLMHQALTRQLANARQGNAKTAARRRTGRVAVTCSGRSRATIHSACR